MLEETGIAIGEPRLSGVYKNMAMGIVALVFRCDHDGQDPVATAEVSEAAWLLPEEISEQLDPAYACRLLDALELQTSPQIRNHDGIQLLE